MWLGHLDALVNKRLTEQARKAPTWIDHRLRMTDLRSVWSMGEGFAAKTTICGLDP